MKYLIVDDHSVMRQAVIEALSQTGDYFDEASTGESAVMLCNQYSYDWVIMDVRMPGMGGFEAARQITARHSGCSVLIMSQFEGGDCVDRAHQCGARAFISKECLADLKEILGNLGKDEIRTAGFHSK